MPQRSQDWIAQAARELQHAEASARDGRHERGVLRRAAGRGEGGQGAPPAPRTRGPGTRRLLGCSLLMLLLGGALTYVECTLGDRIDATFRVRISGRVVDAESHEGVGRVLVVPMRRLHGPFAEESVAARKKWLYTAYATGHPLTGGALTAGDGSFSFVFDISWGWYEGPFGVYERKGHPPAFHSIEGLSLSKIDCDPVVIKTRRGEWHEVPTAGLFATLEMGTLAIDFKD